MNTTANRQKVAGRVSFWMLLIALSTAAIWRPAAAADRNAPIDGPQLNQMIRNTGDALDLDLTRSQIQALHPVLLHGFRQMRHVMRDQKLDGGAKAARIDDIKAALHVRFAAILTPDQEAKVEAARARFDLGLNPGQKAKVADITAGSARAAWAIRGDATLTHEQKRLRFIALRTDTEAKMNAVLTPDQQQKAAARIDGTYTANLLAHQLHLTAAQRDQVKSIVGGAATQSQALFADTSTTPQDKLQKLASVHQAAAAQLSQMLTPAQQMRLSWLKDMRRWRNADFGPGGMGLAGLGMSAAGGGVFG